MKPHTQNRRGFVLLPVILAMSLIAAIAFMLNRDNGINANMASVQLDADKARYAAEAGLQAANAKIQNLGCSGGFPVIGTPVTNNNFSGASYSAYASNAGGNTTNLTSIGTYNGTSITLQRNNVIVYQNALKTYTLQPNGSAGIDTSLNKFAEQNYGIEDKLEAEDNSKNILIKFDFSAFPLGSRPISATLGLLQTNGLAGRLNFYRATQDWLEGTGATSPLDGATWNKRNGVTAWITAGGDYHSTELNPNTVSSIIGDWAELDATDITAAWLSGMYPNYGFLIKSNGQIGNVRYASSDHSTASFRPKITIQYMLPCGTTGPGNLAGGTVTLNPVADSFNDSSASKIDFNNGANTTLTVSNSGSSEERILMQFDTSLVPTGATIQNAKLRLYVGGLLSATSNPKSIFAHAVNESWAEGDRVNMGKSCPSTMVAGTTWEVRDFCVYWNSGLHPPNTPQRWNRMANMLMARSGHMMATVNNKIYVIGGISATGYLNSVEEYNPATNTWTTKTPMPTARGEATATVINGRIHVIGGTNGGAAALTVHERYDPATNSWISRTALPQGRKSHAAAEAGGKIYVMGGARFTTELGTVYEYNPTINSWQTKANMLTSRMWFPAQSHNDKIYVFGGYKGGAFSNSTNLVEQYDPSLNMWVNKMTLPIASDSMGSAMIDGKIYLISGYQGATLTNAAWVYNIASDRFIPILNYPIAVNQLAAAVANGFIYSIGGDSGTFFADNYQYYSGLPAAIAIASQESNGSSPLQPAFSNGWITFDLKALIQEWVDGVRPNHGIVLMSDVADQININSRENSSNKPQLIIEY